MVNFKKKYKISLQFFSELSSEENNNIPELSSTNSNDNNTNNSNKEVEDLSNEANFDTVGESSKSYSEPISNNEFDNLSNEVNFETGEEIANCYSESNSKKVLSSIFDFVEIFSYAIAMMVIVFLFIIKFVTVDGKSMINTLNHEDRLIIYNLFYTPEKNDIIVINYDEGDELLVKRVIGTEGDKVKINFLTWEIWVNDTLLSQPYIDNNLQKLEGKPMVHGTMNLDSDNCSEFIVDEGKIFVMGDNRNFSLDSRSIGQLDVDEILGKVILRVSPFDNMGKVE